MSHLPVLVGCSFLNDIAVSSGCLLQSRGGCMAEMHCGSAVVQRTCHKGAMKQTLLRIFIHHRLSLCPFSPYAGDDFDINDSSGRKQYKLDSSALSLRSGRTLKDASGKVVATMNKKASSIILSWLTVRAHA